MILDSLGIFVWLRIFLDHLAFDVVKVTFRALEVVMATLVFQEAQTTNILF